MLAEHREPGAIEQSCIVPEDLACLADHFPGLPGVPGVLQLDWAMRLTASLIDAEPEVREVEALKFGSTLGPGESFCLRVQQRDRESVWFRIWSDENEYASGRVRFAVAPEDAA